MTDPTMGRADRPLTRVMVLRGALEIIDRDGVDGLSTRRLGEVVGRGPMMLYRHGRCRLRWDFHVRLTAATRRAGTPNPQGAW